MEDDNDTDDGEEDGQIQRKTNEPVASQYRLFTIHRSNIAVLTSCTINRTRKWHKIATNVCNAKVPPKTAHQWIMSLSLSVVVAVNDKHHQLKPNNRTDDYDYDDDDLGM